MGISLDHKVWALSQYRVRGLNAEGVVNRLRLGAGKEEVDHTEATHILSRWAREIRESIQRGDKGTLYACREKKLLQGPRRRFDLSHSPARKRTL